MDLRWVQPWQEQPCLCCWDSSGTAVSWEGPDEDLLHPSLMGGRCQVPTYPAPLPVGKPRQELFLCQLCADSSTEALLKTFPFQPSPAPPFQADQHWIFAGVCDGTNALLRAYCSHVASDPSPPCQPYIMHALTNKSTKETQFCLRSFQKPLTGACRACDSISKSVRRSTVQL